MRTLFAGLLLGSFFCAGAQTAPELPRYGVAPLHSIAGSGTQSTAILSPTLNMVNFPYSIVSSRDNRTYTGTMIGKSPFLRTHTTSTITVQLVPVIITLPDGKVYDPTVVDATCLGTGNSVDSLITSSPLFNNAPFSMNGVNVGTTQYGDAFQRASFWSQVGGTPHHTMLSLTTLAALHVTVPAGKAVTSSGTTCPHSSVDVNWLQNYLEGTAIPSLGSSANSSTFPLFITKSIFAYDSSGCCILGYHGAYTRSNTIQTYSYTSLDASSTFGGDVSTLSHEIGEWLADPLGTNPTPAWGNVGQVSGCQSNLEVGDPVTGSLITSTVNGYTYHLQEMAFYSWFFGSPSIAAGGKYSSNGRFTSAAAACP